MGSWTITLVDRQPEGLAPEQLAGHELRLPGPRRADAEHAHQAGDWSQEIRFASNDNAFWNYTAGMFWEDFDGFTNNYVDLGGPFAMYGSMAGTRTVTWSSTCRFPTVADAGLLPARRFGLSAAKAICIGIRWQEIDGGRSCARQ
ncbi:MAG: hypothetical protein IPF57_24675 [Gammaproteobacteria bacterium]|nr:hypothetical protein [Gammaproteobacteria bacterium]